MALIKVTENHDGMMHTMDMCFSSFLATCSQKQGQTFFFLDICMNLHVSDFSVSTLLN